MGEGHDGLGTLEALARVDRRRGRAQGHELVPGQRLDRRVGVDLLPDPSPADELIVVDEEGGDVGQGRRMFAPAEVVINDLRTGEVFREGYVNIELLEKSFGF